MAKTVIEVNNLSKQYRLGTFGTGSLKDDISKSIARLRGKEDPFAMVGAVNDRAQKADSDYVWALKDIDFKVEQGEILGIIGKNGTGKSTLLKILSNIAPPTTGNIKMRGRVASLLEVGTGFHPELTGRENIFLNGAILGMTKSEINSKLEEIIDFSGVAKYVDTPVKRYSSGMKVRLGFAVAAHLEPEILIVDEVLAVGDAEFQKKAIGKMQEVSQGGGRTVLFVSHNMASVRGLCTKSLVMQNGMLDFNGSVDDGINHYLTGETTSINNNLAFKNLDLPIQFKEIRTEPKIEFNQDIEIKFKVKINEQKPDYTMGFVLYDSSGNCVFVSTIDEQGLSFLSNTQLGEYNITAIIPAKILKPGDYHLTTTIRTMNGKPIHKSENNFGFEIIDTETFRGLKSMYRTTALIAPEINWQLL